MSYIEVDIGQADSVHRAATTNVHGIPDTAQLLLDVAAALTRDLQTFADAFQGAWSAVVDYTAGQLVHHNDAVYVAMAAPAVGDEPGVDPAWEVFLSALGGTVDLTAHNADAAAHPGMVRGMVSSAGGGTAVAQSFKVWNVANESEAAARASGDLVIVRVT